MEVSKAFKIIKLKRGSSSKPRFTKSDGFFHMKSLLKSLCLMVKSLFHVLYPAKKGRYNQHGVTTFCSTIWRCPKMIVAPNHPFVDRIFHEIKLVIFTIYFGLPNGYPMVSLTHLDARIGSSWWIEGQKSNRRAGERWWNWWNTGPKRDRKTTLWWSWEIHGFVSSYIYISLHI